MTSASFFSCLPAVLGAASIALVPSALFSPANAYSVTFSDRTGGDPGGSLVEVNLNSGDIGRTLDPFKWLVPSGTTNSGGETTPIALNAEAIMKVDNLTSNLLSLTITIFNKTNLSTVGSNYRADIVSFGFGVSPNATGVTLSQEGQVFDNAILQSGNNQNFPGGFKNIDVCIFAQDCKAGGKQGLQAGQFDTFKLNIAGNFSSGSPGSTPTASVTLSDFPLKFQTDNGSFEPAGVPEPLTVIGSGLALGFGALFKKQVSTKRKKDSVKS